MEYTKLFYNRMTYGYGIKPTPTQKDDNFDPNFNFTIYEDDDNKEIFKNGKIKVVPKPFEDDVDPNFNFVIYDEDDDY